MLLKNIMMIYSFDLTYRLFNNQKYLLLNKYLIKFKRFKVLYIYLYYQMIEEYIINYIKNIKNKYYLLNINIIFII